MSCALAAGEWTLLFIKYIAFYREYPANSAFILKLPGHWRRCLQRRERAGRNQAIYELERSEAHHVERRCSLPQLHAWEGIASEHP